MIGIENIWSSNMSFMAKCAFWMLGGLTIYAFRAVAHHAFSSLNPDFTFAEEMLRCQLKLTLQIAGCQTLTLLF